MKLRGKLRFWCTFGLLTIASSLRSSDTLSLSSSHTKLITPVSPHWSAQVCSDLSVSAASSQGACLLEE